MLGRLLSIVSGAIFMLTVVVGATPALGAGACALSAPATVKVGDPLVISGIGFPAATTVDVTFAVEGGTTDAFTVQSDGGGGLSISLTPEAADVGVTTVTARAGTTCSAAVTFTVIGPGGAKPTPAPAQSKGGAAGNATAPSVAPRTDATLPSMGGASGGSSNPWLLAMSCLTVGLVSLAMAHQRRSN